MALDPHADEVFYPNIGWVRLPVTNKVGDTGEFHDSIEKYLPIAGAIGLLVGYDAWKRRGGRLFG